MTSWVRIFTLWCKTKNVVESYLRPLFPARPPTLRLARILATVDIGHIDLVRRARLLDFVDEARRLVDDVVEARRRRGGGAQALAVRAECLPARRGRRRARRARARAPAGRARARRGCRRGSRRCPPAARDR